MCDGALKLEIGDEVLARGRETGELASREVMNPSTAAECSIVLSVTTIFRYSERYGNHSTKC